MAEKRRSTTGKQPVEKAGMTVREAGRKGGQKTAETHGHEFYAEIGHKGGQKTSETHGPEFYAEIGHKGGQKVHDLIERGKKRTKE
ncbi:general stress protein [bacterium]|nr:general stress protein [bacterium]